MAIPKKTESQDTEAGDAAYTLGQMAHIVGEKATAARGESTLTSPQRDWSIRGTRRSPAG